jgi:ferritin-like metal-binding protein YciE
LGATHERHQRTRFDPTQYLNEAYSKERELENALEVHIEATTRMPYKKRLREHLTETRAHARAVERRMKQLGGSQSILAEGGRIASAAIGAGKAIAKAPVDLARGSSEQEDMLTNARSEFEEENKEIALYRSLEAFAEQVGDTETAKLARSILRDEERMAKYLDGQIQTLARAVATERVSADQRSKNSTGRRRSTGTRSRGASGTKRRPAAARA